MIDNNTLFSFKSISYLPRTKYCYISSYSIASSVIFNSSCLEAKTYFLTKSSRDTETLITLALCILSWDSANLFIMYTTTWLDFIELSESEAEILTKDECFSPLKKKFLWRHGNGRWCCTGIDRTPKKLYSDCLMSFTYLLLMYFVAVCLTRKFKERINVTKELNDRSAGIYLFQLYCVYLLMSNILQFVIVCVWPMFINLAFLAAEFRLLFVRSIYFFGDRLIQYQTFWPRCELTLTPFSNVAQVCISSAR